MTHLTRIVAFGNCDAATALILHNANVERLVIANPWIIESVDDLPPPAAIKERYARRLRDPGAWIALFTGKLNLRNAIRGLNRVFAPRAQTKRLAFRVATALANDSKPTTILLASGDNTAIAFDDAWKGSAFELARNRADLTVLRFESSSHSFASDTDYAILVETLKAALIQ